MIYLIVLVHILLDLEEIVPLQLIIVDLLQRSAHIQQDDGIIAVLVLLQYVLKASHKLSLFQHILFSYAGCLVIFFGKDCHHVQSVIV